eukprot:GHVO01054730.1.p1 GENE.GHVO01054730.1~~GHVO01054730.1.p1  ORF type:complete len:103 (+),score=4.90 GHVO01054730.1:357-665(+)
MSSKEADEAVEAASCLEINCHSITTHAIAAAFSTILSFLLSKHVFCYMRGALEYNAHDLYVVDLCTKYSLHNAITWSSMSIKEDGCYTEENLTLMTEASNAV